MSSVKCLVFWRLGVRRGGTFMSSELMGRNALTMMSIWVFSVLEIGVDLHELGFNKEVRPNNHVVLSVWCFVIWRGLTFMSSELMRRNAPTWMP